MVSSTVLVTSVYTDARFQHAQGRALTLSETVSLFTIHCYSYSLNLLLFGTWQAVGRDTDAMLSWWMRRTVTVGLTRFITLETGSCLILQAVFIANEGTLCCNLLCFDVISRKHYV